MKVIEIRDIIRKDVPIYYRRLFSGMIKIELVNKAVDYKIDFTIETKPTGVKEIIPTFFETVDYPLVPLIREVKQYIDNLDDAGGLPG
ncbi:hypothetical protein ACYULU_00275 [Breznakiellaceae bacterium SP9]